MLFTRLSIEFVIVRRDWDSNPDLPKEPAFQAGTIPLRDPGIKTREIMH